MASARLIELIARAAAGAAIAYFSWSGIPYALAGCALLLWLWHAPTRIASVLAIASYFATTALPFATGGAGFFHSLMLAIFVYAALIVLLTLPWALLWSALPSLWRAPLALAIAALPPYGVIGMYSPLTATGELWPGTGLVGLIAFMVMSAAVSYRPVHTLLLVMLTSIVSQTVNVPVAPLSSWSSVDTTKGGTGYGATSLTGGREFDDYQAMFALARKSSAQVLVLPESTVPTVQPTAEDFFSVDFDALRARNQTVLFGADTQSGSYWVNSIVSRGVDSAVWSQRMPIPVAMWRPWDEAQHNPARFTGPHVIEVRGERVAPLICYEISLVWPVVFASLDRPTVIVAISNIYWANGTPVTAQARAVVRAWARLFSIPYLVAMNT